MATAFFLCYPLSYQGILVQLLMKTASTQDWPVSGKTSSTFALHSNIFELFKNPKKIKLLHHGYDSVHSIFNSFLLPNCYNCFNELSSSFGVDSPLIEDYLPLYEVLPPASNVTDLILEEIYTYDV